MKEAAYRLAIDIGGANQSGCSLTVEKRRYRPGRGASRRLRGDLSTGTVRPGDVHRVDAAFDQPAPSHRHRAVESSGNGQFRRLGDVPRDRPGDLRRLLGEGNGHECTGRTRGFGPPGRSRAARRGRSSRPAPDPGPAPGEGRRRAGPGGDPRLAPGRRGDGGAERRGADRDASHPSRRCLRRRAGGGRRPRLPPGVDRPERHDDVLRRSLRMLADAGGDGPASVGRGSARGAVAAPGRHRARPPGTLRDVVRGVGPERQKRARGRGLQRLGRPGSPDAGAGQLRRLGDLPPGSRARGSLQVRGGQPGRAPQPAGRSVRLRRGGAARPPPASSPGAPTSGRTRSGSPSGPPWTSCALRSRSTSAISGRGG